MSLQDQRRLVMATGLPVVETHISLVLLGGTFAYKIKKAVDLDFLDFTTLAGAPVSIAARSSGSTGGSRRRCIWTSSPSPAARGSGGGNVLGGEGTGNANTP